MYFKWGPTMSSKFHVTNGVRQGSVLSPLLFNVYVNYISECLNRSGGFNARKSMCIYFSTTMNKHRGLNIP